MREQEYKELVIADFQAKLEAGVLSSELVVPTPGNIKAKCLERCQDSFDKNDEQTLISFYNKRECVEDYIRAIQNEGADKFRPLNSYLRSRTGNPNLKYINLLAWLIDFTPRPYHHSHKIKRSIDQGINEVLPIELLKGEKKDGELFMPPVDGLKRRDFPKFYG